MARFPCIVDDFRLTFHFNFRQRKRMTKRNEPASFLGSHDSSDSCCRQNVAFFCRTGDNRVVGFFIHRNETTSNGSAFRHVLGADVNHSRLAFFVNVCEQPHLLAPDLAHFSFCPDFEVVRLRFVQKRLFNCGTNFVIFAETKWSFYVEFCV